jgi:hypothetical protein
MAAELAPKVPGQFFGVAPSWCHAWSVELAAGRVASHSTWEPHASIPRQYGWNELVDVDGDGVPDLVNVSLTKHVDVLRNNGTGRLSLAWSHEWDDVITTEKRSLRPISNSAIDVDGDGKKKVIAGLFDGLDDGRWHLFVWDAATGGGQGRGARPGATGDGHALGAGKATGDPVRPLDDRPIRPAADPGSLVAARRQAATGLDCTRQHPAQGHGPAAHRLSGDRVQLDQSRRPRHGYRR